MIILAYHFYNDLKIATQTQMQTEEIHTLTKSKKFILLADDDLDDCMLFENALSEIAEGTKYETVENGEKLMQYLSTADFLPDIIFMDMNMPRKNGAACLTEIKANEKLKSIPIVIISTSLEPSLIEFLYTNGAHYFIRKPNSFSKLKFVLYHAITLLSTSNTPQPELEHFILIDEKPSS